MLDHDEIIIYIILLSFISMLFSNAMGMYTVTATIFIISATVSIIIINAIRLIKDEEE